MRRTVVAISQSVIVCLCFASNTIAQPPGPGGPPGSAEERKIFEQFDTNRDGWLNREERAAARVFIKENPVQGIGPGGRPLGGGIGGRPGPDPKEIFRMEDSNSDGVLTQDELGDSPLADRFDEIDADKDKKISAEEFEKAHERIMAQRQGEPGGPPGGFGQPGGGPGGPPGGGRGRGATRPEAKPGKKIGLSDVELVKGKLYDPDVLRTIFIQFENEDWEKELEDFYNSDVDVPATLIVDGKQYPLCGIRFRGASSYFMTPAGYKRSFNVSLDMVDTKQDFDGFSSLNLLNGNGDNTMMSSVLYSELAGKHLPVPKANFVRVVVNGESWGIYTNVQQFNKDFLGEHFESTKGARWKVNGSPRGGGGLDYRGQDPGRYGSPYELKGGDEQDATARLIELCRVLEETPVDQLESAITKMVDVDGLLWFLAYDVALCNSDGYWIRASDYSIFLDSENKFHFFPHDMNESFRIGGGGGPGGRRGPGGGGGPVAPGGPGGGVPGGGGAPGGPGGGGVPGVPGGGGERNVTNTNGPDPLIGLDDPMKPLRSKILAVPSFRRQYLENIRTIAGELKWENFGPLVKKHRELIAEEVELDTRKLGTYESFVQQTSDGPPAGEAGGDSAPQTERGPGATATSLRQFAEKRSKYLLEAVEKHMAEDEQ